MAPAGRVFGAISSIAKGSQRRCPSCNEDVAFNARSCRHCGYGFS